MILADKMRMQLGAISIEEAVEILMDMGYADEPVVIPDEKGNRTSSPWRILNEEYMADYPAVGCTLMFCGGPPGNTSWYTGSLLTLVIDKLMLKITEEKLKFFMYERPGFKIKVKAGC